MTINELYTYLLENYGSRHYWISDIASSLNISRYDANYLTYMLGYRRGKEGSLKTESQFISDPRVRLIHAKM